MQNSQSQQSSSSSSSSISNLSLKDPKTTLSIILTASFLSLLLFFLSLSSTSTTADPSARPDPSLFPTRPARIAAAPTPPSIAYLVSGSDGDSARILRLLRATYHPRNRYLLHLDRSARASERDRLALAVQSVPIYRAAMNVDVIGKPDFVYAKGSSSLAFALHGASMHLRLSESWDWFVLLDAGDYPLVTQDDLLHILSYVPKSLNFVKHSSYIGWRQSKKLKPIIVDPGLYLSEKSAMFYATQKRPLPNAYQLFTGSPFSILSRNLVEFAILGTDNLPRTLLMYFSNTPSSLSNYFPTLICNLRQFNKTIVNHNLKFSKPAKPASEEDPRRISEEDFNKMVQSGVAFAAKFEADDPLLERVDRELLGLEQGQVVPGGWCVGGPGNGSCSLWGDADILRPGPGAKRLEKLLVELLSNSTSNRCLVE